MRRDRSSLELHYAVARGARLPAASGDLWYPADHAASLAYLGTFRRDPRTTHGLDVAIDSRWTRRPDSSIHATTEVTLMHLRPLHDRIVVHRLEEGEQHIGGIIIPDTAKEKPQQGTVIAAGNGKVNDDGKRFPLDVKAGDRILFGRYAGQEIKLDGKEYLILKEDDVLAVIVDTTTKKTAVIKGQTEKKTTKKTTKKKPKKVTKKSKK